MKQHLQKIDFLRGIAILMVFVFHSESALYPDFLVLTYKQNGIINAPGVKSLILNLSPPAFGWTGVTLFFIISGFLIHLGYLRNQDSFSIRTFYSKRFWRIFPAYWLALFFFCFCTGGFWLYFFYRTGFENFVLHVFALHNLLPATFYTINPSYWSIAVEVQLYLIYPVLLYVRKRIGIGKTFILILLLSLTTLMLEIIFDNKNVFGYRYSVIEFWFEWAAGAYMAEAYFNDKRILKNAGLLISLLLLLLLIPGKYFVYTNYFLIYIATLSWVIFIDWLLGNKKIKMESRFSKLIINIGLCSYSIYLIHQPFLFDMVNFFNIISNKHLTRILNIVPAFAVIFLISWSLYQYVELPSVAFGNKLRKRKENQ